MSPAEDLERIFKRWGINEEPFRSLFENMQEIIGICATDGTIRYVSPSVTRIAGYPENEAIGRNFSEFVYPEDLPPVVKSFQDAQAKDGVPVPATCRYQHRNGNWYWSECVWTGHLCDPKIGGVVFNVHDVTERKAIDAELNRSRAELRALARRNQSIREEEAKRLSTEIHDRMGQSLTVLKLALTSLEQAIREESGANCPENLQSLLIAMNQAVSDALNTARRVSLDLRPRTLDELGLVAALEEEARAFEDRTSIVCKLAFPENEPLIESEKVIAAFRIFQEALTNVARHANASELSVDLDFSDGNLRLAISDNGTGFLPGKRAAPSLGLIGMQERALAAGLRVNISGSPDGTRVVVEGPYDGG